VIRKHLLSAGGVRKANSNLVPLLLHARCSCIRVSLRRSIFMRTDQKFHTRGNILPFFRGTLRMWGIWECDVAFRLPGGFGNGVKAASASERGG